MLPAGPDALLALDASGTVRVVNMLATAAGFAPGGSVCAHVAAAERAAFEGIARHGFLGVSDRIWTLDDGMRVHIAACADGEGGHLLSIRPMEAVQGLSGLDRDRLKTEALAEVAGALARELTDAASIVQGRLELMVELAPAGQADPKLAAALDHARRVSATLQNLRLVGQAPLSLLERVPIAECVERALDVVAPGRRRSQFEVAVGPAEACGGERAAFVRIVANVLQYLIDLVGRDRLLRITADPSREGVRIRVSTLGMGAGEPVDLAAAGLQMAVTTSLVRSLGCSLSVCRGGTGAAALLIAPHAPDRPQRARPVEQRLLTVGCDGFRGMVGTVLDAEGYEIVHVRSAECALDALSRDTALDAMLAAMLLPGMSGLTLARAVKERHPRLLGRVGVVADPGAAVAEDVTIVHPPLSRTAVLAALGRQTRRRVAPSLSPR